MTLVNITLVIFRATAVISLSLITDIQVNNRVPFNDDVTDEYVFKRSEKVKHIFHTIITTCLNFNKSHFQSH